MLIDLPLDIFVHCANHRILDVQQWVVLALVNRACYRMVHERLGSHLLASYGHAPCDLIELNRLLGRVEELKSLLGSMSLDRITVLGVRLSGPRPSLWARWCLCALQERMGIPLDVDKSQKDVPLADFKRLVYKAGLACCQSDSGPFERVRQMAASMGAISDLKAHAFVLRLLGTDHLASLMLPWTFLLLVLVVTGLPKALGEKLLALGGLLVIFIFNFGLVPQKAIILCYLPVLFLFFLIKLGELLS